MFGPDGIERADDSERFQIFFAKLGYPTCKIGNACEWLKFNDGFSD